MCDCVPPLALNNNYNNSWNKFSDNYKTLLYDLNPGDGGNKLQEILGDNYANWIDTLKKDTSKDSAEKIFGDWADKNLGPSVAQAAKNVYAQQALNPIFIAINDVKDAITFTEKISDIRNEIRTNGKSAKIQSSSESFKSISSSSWATECIVEPYFFDVSSEESAISTSINNKMMASIITIEGNIRSYVSVQVKPGKWFDSSMWPKHITAKIIIMFGMMLLTGIISLENTET